MVYVVAQVPHGLESGIDCYIGKFFEAFGLYSIKLVTGWLSGG